MFSSEFAFIPHLLKSLSLFFFFFFGTLGIFQFGDNILLRGKKHIHNGYKKCCKNSLKPFSVALPISVSFLNLLKITTIYTGSHAPQNAYKGQFVWTYHLISLTASVIPQIPALFTTFVTTSDVTLWFVIAICWVIFFRICSSRSCSKVCRSLLVTKLDVSHWRSDSEKSLCWSPKNIILTDSLTWAST